ncbi:MAG: inositol monophosphatase [Bacteroides sp.]|nr:inositol monophosphatase [Bacteroides sp.]
MNYHDYMTAAVQWAESAGMETLKYFRSSNLRSVTKQNDFDVLTEADKASERIIIESIRSTFPDHSILSEESGESSNPDSDWLWVIDPLDGTTNFKQGLPVYSISIALQYRGETVAGVVYAPYLGEMFSAYKGGGAYLNNHPIHCGRNGRLSTMVTATGMPYDRAVHPDNNLGNIARVSTQVRGIRRMGSAAIDLAYTAAGYFDAYWELNLNLWDVAAGILLVTEAGGIVESIRTDRNHSVMAGSRESLDAFRHLIE